MVIDYVIVTMKNHGLFLQFVWCDLINIGYWLCDSYYRESESIPLQFVWCDLINIGYWLCDSYYKESESIPFNLIDVTDKYWLLIMW